MVRDDFGFDMKRHQSLSIGTENYCYRCFVNRSKLERMLPTILTASTRVREHQLFINFNTCNWKLFDSLFLAIPLIKYRKLLNCLNANPNNLLRPCSKVLIEIALLPQYIAIIIHAARNRLPVCCFFGKSYQN